jgi:hypothetical protein
VDDGVFSAVIGSPELGMHPINSSIFSSQTPLRLRTWFSGNGLGFEQLDPDQKLVDLTLNTIMTATQDYSIYVDGVSGNDENSGLTTSTAKRTIQAGVDAVPRQLRCNVTVSVFPGIYRETVDVSGISGSGIVYGAEVIGNRLILMGDPLWTPASGGAPNVRLTGCDNDLTSAPVRLFGLNCHNNTTVEISGFLFDWTSATGVRCESGTYLLKNCVARNNTFSGIALWAGGYVHADGVVSSRNGNHGFSLAFSHMWLTNCIAEYNPGVGIYANVKSHAQVFSATLRNNGTGCIARDHGSALFATATVQNNTVGLEAQYDSMISGVSGVTFSGNGTNSRTIFGGHVY